VFHRCRMVTEEKIGLSGAWRQCTSFLSKKLVAGVLLKLLLRTPSNVFLYFFPTHPHTHLLSLSLSKCWPNLRICARTASILETFFSRKEKTEDRPEGGACILDHIPPTSCAAAPSKRHSRTQKSCCWGHEEIAEEARRRQQHNITGRLPAAAAALPSCCNVNDPALHHHHHLQHRRPRGATTTTTPGRDDGLRRDLLLHYRRAGPSHQMLHESTTKSIL